MDHGKRAVKISILPWTFAFLVGLTFCGLATSLVELASGCPARLAAPAVNRERFWWSLGMVTVAGPYMLVNEALEGWRAGILGPVFLGGTAATAVAWTTAWGILLVELAFRVSALIP